MLFGMTLLCSGEVYSKEAELGVRSFYQERQASASSFAVPEFFRLTPFKRTDQEVYLNLQQGAWTFRGQAIATQQLDGSHAHGKGIINELYVDFSMADLEASVGKKVVSWGVGYGYRPLDVIQRETRQALRTFDLEGVPILQLESFTATSAITAIIAQRVRFDGMHPQVGGYEGALKYSGLLADTDVHVLLYHRQGEGVSMGAGVSTIFGVHLAWHGSVRYLPSYTSLQHKLSGQDPTLLRESNVFTAQQQQHGLLALLGASWTWASGCSLMLEAWHDDTAWTHGQWQELFRINAIQRQQLSLGAPEQAVYGNINANSRAYSQQNLLKDTLFMRLAYDGDQLDPNVSVLYTPADGGMVFTASADYDWSEAVLLFASVRLMGGKANAAYSNAADRRQLFVGLQIYGGV